MIKGFIIGSRYKFHSLKTWLAIIELSTRLDYLVKKRGIGLVTGEVGSGKTTGIRALCHALNPGLYKPLYLPNTTGSVLDLNKSLAELLGLIDSSSRAKLYIQIHHEIERLVESKKISPLLIVDEAHLLRIEALEEIRLLTNYQMTPARRVPAGTSYPYPGWPGRATDKARPQYQ